MRNSDRPSSSDHKVPPKKRKKSPRPKGGPLGRKGAHRELLEATEVIKMPIDHPCPCGGSWAPLHEPECFQVTELPEVKPRVIEYHVQRHRCTCCGSVAHLQCLRVLWTSDLIKRLWREALKSGEMR